MAEKISGVNENVVGNWEVGTGFGAVGKQGLTRKKCLTGSSGTGGQRFGGSW